MISEYVIDHYLNIASPVPEGLTLNSLAPGRFQQNIRKKIKLILVTDGCDISYEIVLRWMPLDLTDYKSTLVRVMARCHYRKCSGCIFYCCFLGELINRFQSLSKKVCPITEHALAVFILLWTWYLFVCFHDFTHILYGGLIGTRAIDWLSRCHNSRPDGNLIESFTR